MERRLTTLVMLLFVFLVLGLSIPATAAYNVPAVFVFGDSIFDAGNNRYNKPNCSVQADFQPYGSAFFHHPTGRFTNGRTVADFISQFIGIPLQKPFLEAKIEFINGTRKNYPSNGLNFASAGSGVLKQTNNDSGVTPLLEQLQQFKSLVQQNLIDKKLVYESLFFLESGSNDVFNYFSPLNTDSREPGAYVKAMLAVVYQFIDEIYSLGARRIALFSLGPVGCIPARTMLVPGITADKCFDNLNKMTKEYNLGLENFVKIIPTNYSGAIGVYGSVYDVVQQFQTTPKQYGFIDVSSACCGYGNLRGELQCGREGYKLCSDPNKFLFWDYFHPSEHTYELISKFLWAGGLSRIRPINLKALANITLITP